METKKKELIFQTQAKYMKWLSMLGILGFFTITLGLMLGTI